MKFKKSLFSIIVCAFTFFLVSTNIFAVDVQNKLKDVPVTEGLLNEGYIPNKYYVDSFSSLAGSSNNPYYIENVLQYANLSKFSLRDIIPENVVIRDQGKENSCWAFSTIACLESNLALKNRQKGKPTKVYDFSEQYMVSGSFYDNYLNGQINKKGLNVKPYVGGNFERAMGNVTSGNGVIDESSYPYLNSEAPVDINSLSNKKVTADILDTVIFESPKNEEQFMKLKKAVKEHIVQNGGVYVALRMPKIGDYKFNPVKGSVYNDVKAAQNHTVTIIGWDDNYPKENFNFKPDNNGAWLVKNSYVAHLEQNVDEVKNEIYEFLKSYFNLNGIHSANEIDDNYLIEALNAEYKRQFNIEPVKLVQREDGKKYASIDINTGGYLYISYEDKTLSDYIGIVRAIEKIDYDNIYQNCYYVSGYRDYLTTNNKKIYGVLLGEQYEVNSESSFFDNEEFENRLDLSLSQIISLKKIKKIILEREASIYNNRKMLTDQNDYFSLWIHQIKTPITSINILLQNMNSSKDEIFEIKRALLSIDNYTQMALHYLKLQRPDKDLDFLKFNLNEVLQNIFRKYRSIFIYKNIELNYKPCDLNIISDPVLFELMIEQVISNSLKYCGIDGKRGMLSIYIENQNPSVLIIEDNGIGISPSDLPKIFDKGYSGLNGRLSEKATGLGLYLAREISERLGCTLTINSRQGEWTRAEVKLGTETSILTKM